MLPLPNSSSSSRPNKSRMFFPSSTSPHPSYSSTTHQIITTLRSRTRLTNLAVSLLLLLLTTSLLLNLNTLLLRPSTYHPGRRKWEGWEDNATPQQLDSGIPLSIETTIERDPRFEELDHLIMVPGHAIWIGNDPERLEEDDQWILEGIQGGGSVKTYVKHIREGVRRLESDPNSLLIFSGGATRLPPSPPLAEAQSYLNIATALRLIQPASLPPLSSPLPLYLRTATEEYALDSYENLLFALARFKEVTGRWPVRVTIVGYGMKRRRYEHLHRASINFPLEQFEYFGIDDEGDTTEHYAGELKYGYTPFLSSPSGCHPPLSTKRLLRNPYARYHPYHTSCPEISDLLEWCPPLVNPPQGEDAPGAIYEGWVPWRDMDDQIRWGREWY
ncbi:hypothetical protein BCR39DRAFT_539840 [Naematelia encephala]|uniref:Uncharacterized protein n=1 Tax=Naematelia encephala TaxID=71784 RepID=A0A1Y2AYA7_9TREE|nr:hypothetical protein BCR39DRAFT_539840 [Naematelia encephala]